MSSLPAGVTDREIDALCGDENSQTYDCMRCLQSFYEGDDFYDPHHVNGATTCYTCTNMCAGCGEWLDDITFPAKVIEIRFREWANDGKLSDAHCPICAANEILGGMLGERNFDFNDFPGEWGKDAIAQLLAKAFPLPEAVAA